MGKKPKNPLDKNKDETPKNLGSGEDSKKETRTPSPVELDEYAAEFVKSTGMKPESVESALKGDAPTYLAGKI
jgi:hypothetical protein